MRYVPAFCCTAVANSGLRVAAQMMTLTAPVLKRTDTDVSELDSMPTPALTRQNTEVSERATPPPSTPAEELGPLELGSSTKDAALGIKKVKITAWNGWEARLKLEEREKKRVRRARSSMSMEDDTLEGRPLLRRASTRGKLAQLPSLPLDILFEVRLALLNKFSSSMPS